MTLLVKIFRFQLLISIVAPAASRAALLPRDILSYLSQSGYTPTAAHIGIPEATLAADPLPLAKRIGLGDGATIQVPEQELRQLLADLRHLEQQVSNILQSNGTLVPSLATNTTTASSTASSAPYPDTSTAGEGADALDVIPFTTAVSDSLSLPTETADMAGADIQMMEAAVLDPEESCMSTATLSSTITIESTVTRTLTELTTPSVPSLAMRNLSGSDDDADKSEGYFWESESTAYTRDTSLFIPSHHQPTGYGGRLDNLIELMTTISSSTADTTPTASPEIALAGSEAESFDTL